MNEILTNLFPYVMKKPEQLWKSLSETLQMTLWSGSIMFVLGLALGLLLTVTREGGILENKGVYQVLDKVINIFRSIPFVILIALLMNLTKWIMGTRIGVRGVIVPLVFGSVPFFARQVDAALAGVDKGLVEAAQAMGTSSLGIIFRVYLREGAPAIARGTTITLINLVGLTAMSGYVGAGGLGDYAITYGYNYNRIDIVWAAVIVTVLLVSIIQAIGSLVARKTTH
ncbi:MAG: ABC transporter permease [Clostridia bacterium]|nr:ABC transporter permease [Clostridia bacterium]